MAAGRLYPSFEEPAALHHAVRLAILPIPDYPFVSWGLSSPKKTRNR
jgi:hypothetical protein